MAYADKSTDMRRMVISKGGHVIYEGVNIEGDCLLMKREEFINTIVIHVNELYQWIKELNKDTNKKEPYLILYQDGNNNDWDVKEDYIKKLEEKSE